jgi:hypothetical protein
MGDRDQRRACAAGVGSAPRAGYRVEHLRQFRVADAGVLHATPSGERLLPWSDVRFALAAEVGEPEGVRAIVFDLVLGGDAVGCRVARLDADPGPVALEIARAIHDGVGAQQRGPSIKSLASDGVASWWYADLESFEDAAAAVIPPCALRRDPVPTAADGPESRNSLLNKP